MSDISPFAKGGVVRVQDLPEVRALVRATEAAMAKGETGLFAVQKATFAWCYMNHGNWIADCPDRCNNAELMMVGSDRTDFFYCSNCKIMSTSVVWPEEDGEDVTDAITEILNRRPNPLNRNWYPAGHWIAVDWGLESGQTVAALLVENNDHGID